MSEETAADPMVPVYLSQGAQSKRRSYKRVRTPAADNKDPNAMSRATDGFRIERNQVIMMPESEAKVLVEAGAISIGHPPQDRDLEVDSRLRQLEEATVQGAEAQARTIEVAQRTDSTVSKLAELLEGMNLNSGAKKIVAGTLAERIAEETENEEIEEPNETEVGEDAELQDGEGTGTEQPPSGKRPARRD